MLYARKQSKAEKTLYIVLKMYVGYTGQDTKLIYKSILYNCCGDTVKISINSEGLTAAAPVNATNRTIHK